MDEAITRRVEVDHAAKTIKMPHWGITMRTLFGAALDSWVNPQPGESREFTVLYKDKAIATLNVHQHNES